MEQSSAMKMKFLFIRLSSIGDIVLTTPVVRCLKQQIPGAEIHFVTKHKYKELLFANPHIDRIHTLNDHFRNMLKELKAQKFDYIIDLHNNIRSSFIKLALRVPAFSFRKLNLQKWLMVKLKVDVLPDVHIVERYFKTLSRFRVIPDGKGLDYFIPPGKEFDFSRLPGQYRDGYIAAIISGTYATKQLPALKVAEICESIGYPVILVGGNHETPVSREIDKLVGDHVFNLAGKTTINESASLVRDARLVLTNDTGMMHIAAAFGKKILSFWGNTVPKFGMYPYQPHPASKIMEVAGLKCRPCSKLGYPKCPKKHLHCLNDIDIPGAVKWINENYGI